MKRKKELMFKYSVVNSEQTERQIKLDDAFDVVFDELDILDTEHIDNKDEYEHATIIKR